jgi:hypothetical protein
MSHDTHQEHSKENKSIIPFKNGFWLVIIIVGLFIAALNFIQAESHSEEGNGAKTEYQPRNETKGNTEVKENQATENKAAESTPAQAPATDSAANHKEAAGNEKK